MQGKDPERTPSYFDGDIYIPHNTGIAGDFSDLGAVERSAHAVPGTSALRRSE